MEPAGANDQPSFAYEVELEDIHAFNRHWAQTTPGALRNRRLIQGALTFLLASMLVALGAASQAPPGFWLAGLAILAAWFMLFPRRVEAMVRQQTERQYRAGKSAGLLGPHRITLADEWLVESTELRESRTRWQAVERLELTADHAFLYLTSFSAVIVPRRCFESRAAFEAFAAEVRRRLEEVRRAG